jgi:chromosome segregation protein
VYLKSLTLKGFKSFADRAHLAFEPGLTVIVGPNGSGKSNVSDAILWVLGEQSAKQLRGQAMEDVVFAGSSARKAAGLAEVDLTLDNSDHRLPVDFEEVVVTRRMYRSGESEYLINGAPARLLDITDILHDSGLGKDTHSIIGQGKLDAILASRPEERRALIEEAAGISKHKRRRERALKRLSSMDEHLKRALDVQREVARQLKPLERQVEKARTANELEARAKELRVGLAVDDLRALKASWERLEAAEQASEREEAEVSARLEAAQAVLARCAVEQEAADAASGAVVERAGRAKSSAERLEGLARLAAEKARTADEGLRQANAAHDEAAARHEAACADLAAARAERDANRASKADLRTRCDAANVRVREAREARRAGEDALTRAQTRVRTQTRERDAAGVALAKARDAAANAKVQEELYAGRIAQVEDAAARASEELAAARERLGQAQGAAARAEEAERTARAAQASATEGLTAARDAETAAARALAAAEARAHALARAAEADENAVPLAATLARGAAAGRARVSEALDVPADLSELVERLLGEALTGFVAADRADLSKLAEAARALAGADAGRVALVAPDAAEAARGDAGLPGFSLVERIGADGAARALLGDVRVVETAAEAVAAAAADPASRYATRAGDVVCRGSQVLVGCAREAAAGLLERRRELREVEVGLPALETAAADARAARDAADAALTEARRALDACVRERASASGEAAALAKECDRLEAAARKASGELDGLAAQRDAAARKAADAAAAVDAAAAAVQASEAALAEVEAGVPALEEAFEAARKAERAAHEEASACQLEIARVNERASGLDARCERLQREVSDLMRRVESTEAEAARFAARSRRAAALSTCLPALAEAAAGLRGATGEEASQVGERALRAKGALDAARAAVDAENAAHARALAALGDVKVAKGRLDVQVDAAVKAIAAQPGVVLEEALELPAPADRAADERELSRVEAKLAQIGPVNQVAFEEYGALKRRHDYIAAQADDLQRARADLTKILAAIDRKMRTSFTETFDLVNANFQEIFATLFPGGEGHLELTDPDDPAATGVEVVAQPRGKRVTKMSLLSGGERSLTALGLLFAVYRTRTVPFYVLDEVEAALDDSNLDRLLAALEVLRKSTQLIVISHQRRTMEAADVLYGVSMQADGVSRVVSQRLDRAVELAGA